MTGDTVTIGTEAWGDAKNANIMYVDPLVTPLIQ